MANTTRRQNVIHKDGSQVVRQPWLHISKIGESFPYISTSGCSYPYTTDENPSSAGLRDTAAIEMAQPDGKTFRIFDSKYEQLMLDNYVCQIICRKEMLVADDDPCTDCEPLDQRDLHIGFQQMIDAGTVRVMDA